MQKTFNNPYFPELKRVRQKTVVHCGPAVVEMLVGYLGLIADQEQIVDAGESRHKLLKLGMTAEELGKAVDKLFPHLVFWYKRDANINLLSEIINVYKYPVGVEWQGVFDYPEDEEDKDEEYGEEDDDPGHFSVVTHIDTHNNIVMLADPERHYAGIDRRFSVLDFKRRWWDENTVKDPKTGKVKQVFDNHLLFIITPKDETFPENLGMIRG